MKGIRFTLQSKPLASWLFLNLLLLFALLLVNLSLGHLAIVAAQLQHFNGGACFAVVSATCSKSNGFDMSVLLYTLMIFALSNGIISTLVSKNFRHALLSIVLWSIVLVMGIELLVRVMQIPVLQTEFMESRQSMTYGFMPNFAWDLVVLCLSTFIGTCGVVVGHGVRFVERQGMGRRAA